MTTLAPSRPARRRCVIPDRACRPDELFVRMCSVHKRVCLIDDNAGQSSGVFCQGAGAGPHQCHQWFTVNMRTGKIIYEATINGVVLEVHE